MRLHSVYRFIFSSLILLLLDCSDIDRDNLLDPKNPSSQRESTLFLEAFINTKVAYPEYNFFALEAIDSLSAIYADRLIWVEYHWDTTNPDYKDDLSVSGVDELYDDYAETKGVPDLFINGSANRVQGASDTSNVIKRVHDIASNLIIIPSEYTCEAEFKKTGNQISGTYRIARLGNASSYKMLLRIVLTADTGLSGSRTVTKIEIPIPIIEIDAGDYFEGDFIVSPLPQNANKIVFILKDQTDRIVLHAIEKDL